LGRALTDAGGALSSVVRVDQYFSNRDAVAPYHVARKLAFGGSVPPSTSVLVGGLLEPGALMDVQAMATTLDSSLAARPVHVAGIVAPAASASAAGRRQRPRSGPQGTGLSQPRRGRARVLEGVVRMLHRQGAADARGAA